MSDKIPIVVYAWHTIDSSGGFQWAPDTPENRLALRDVLMRDLENENCNTGTLVTLSVLPLTAPMITDLLEWQLQDAIEVGYVGHIIARFSQEI